MVWTRKSKNSDEIGKWTPQPISNSDGVSCGRYSILIHGATDADICVEKFKITAYTAANATASDKNTSIATEGELGIVEPKGVILFDLIAAILSKMETDTSSCVFVIKTFFVGHGTDGGVDFSNTIVDVAPVMCLLTDATAVYSETGGTYTLQVVALTNGAARLPQFARAAAGATLNLDKKIAGRATVAVAASELFRIIRENYEHHYNCVQAMASQKNVDNPTKQFYKVEYMIDVDPVYHQDKYFLSDSPAQFKTHGGDCSAPPSIKNKVDSSIEDAIHNIMLMCPQVKRDMQVGDEKGIKYEYKIHSTVSTVMDGDTKKLRVIYSVRRFMSPRGFNILELIGDGNGNGGMGDGDVTANRLRENIIEFDYIFSGKNIDILEFNMQVNYGLSYLQTAASSNSFKQQLELVASSSRHISTYVDQQNRMTDKPVPVPVFFSPQLKGLTTNNTNEPGLSVGAAFTMAKHASLEVAEASVKIVGNPMLYSTVGLTTQPSNIGRAPNLENNTVENGAKDTPSLEYGDFRHWSHMPALAVINIYMPAHNDDIGLMTGARMGEHGVPIDYRKRFWYDGYYYVYGVENVFDQGEFTQQLLMVAIPNGSLLESGKLKKSTEDDVKSLVECYNNKVPVPPPKTTPEPVPFYKRAYDEIKNFVTGTKEDPSKETKMDPTTKQDSDSVIKSAANDPTKIVGWDKAAPEVKEAIRNAASQSGIDISLLAQFAYKESTFKPTAAPKGSTAVGLYQHIDGTWMGLVKGNKIPGIPPNTPDVQALPLRTNPTYSALGGAAYIKIIDDKLTKVGAPSASAGDIYLCYFFGDTAGPKVIAACESGRGSALLETVTSPEHMRKVYAANPYAKWRTCDELRAWCATEMAKTVVGGVPLAVKPIPKQPMQVQQPPPKDASGTPKTVAASVGGGINSDGKYTAKGTCGTKQLDTPESVAPTAAGSKK